MPGLVRAYGSRRRACDRSVASDPGPGRASRPGPADPRLSLAPSGTPAAGSVRAYDGLVLPAATRPGPGPLGPDRPDRPVAAPCCWRYTSGWLRPSLGRFGPSCRLPSMSGSTGPGPAQLVHGSPRLPAAHQRLAQLELMTVWSLRPHPDQVRARPARPGPAGSSVAPGVAGQPKCRSRRA